MSSERIAKINDKNGNVMLVILVVVILVTLAGVGYWYTQNGNSVSPTPTMKPTPTTSSIDTSDWKTYTNEEYGFSYLCPEWVECGHYGVSGVEELDENATITYLHDGITLNSSMSGLQDKILGAITFNVAIASLNSPGSLDELVSTMLNTGGYKYMYGSQAEQYGYMASTHDFELAGMVGKKIDTFESGNVSESTLLVLQKTKALYFVINTFNGQIEGDVRNYRDGLNATILEKVVNSFKALER